MKRTFESRIADAFSFSDQVWERHAHPWSVWTRFTILPLLIVAVWSRVWMGPWAWLAVAGVLLWTWLNPRIFPKPLSTDHWASRAVLGERVWLNRNEVPVPETHRLAPHLLTALSGSGLPFLVVGLWQLSIWPTVLGAVLVYAGKVWFLDRMVWLYQDMYEAVPEYRAWLYTRPSRSPGR